MVEDRYIFYFALFIDKVVVIVKIKININLNFN